MQDWSDAELEWRSVVAVQCLTTATTAAASTKVTSDHAEAATRHTLPETKSQITSNSQSFGKIPILIFVL